jgi:proteasome lid subunit RPN8/RPN11
MLAPMDLEPNQPFDAATTVEHSPEGNGAIPPLLLSGERLDTIVEHLRGGLPNEGCGLIASIPTRHGDRGIHFFPGANIDRSPVRYTMDPKEVIDAMWWMRTLNWDLAAIVHSHPSTAPTPSRTDLREWYYQHARLLIISFVDDVPAVGCWRLPGDGQAREFRLTPFEVVRR